MLNAEKNALRQNAEQELLQIRDKELSYFVANFSSFATQSSLIAGFTLSALTGLDPSDYDASDFLETLFHLSCILCLTSSMYCILTSIFVTVWGPGLALRGEEGSMAKAVEGMLSEKDEIFYSFCASLAFFMLVTISTAIITMSITGSVLTVVIIVIGGFILYKKSRKLYVRFLVRDDHAWKRKRTDERKNRTLGNGSGSGGSGSRRGRDLSEDKSEYDGEFSTGSFEDSTHDGLPSSHVSMRSQQGSRRHELSAENKIGEEALDISPAMKTVNHEGYLWKRGRDNPNSVKKRYFVVYDNFSKMDYYETQSAFVRGERPIKNRPIHLHGYEFIVVESPEAGTLVDHQHEGQENEESKHGLFSRFAHHKKNKKAGLEKGLLDSDSETTSTTSGSQHTSDAGVDSSLPHQQGQEQYEFVLRPVRRDDERRNWEFVVSSKDELLRWKSVFSKHT